eukprot:s2155_g3.t1
MEAACRAREYLGGAFGKSAAPSPARGKGQLRVAFILGSLQAAALLRRKAQLRARAASVLDEEEEEDDLQEEDADDYDDDYDDYEDDPNYEGPWQHALSLLGAMQGALCIIWGWGGFRLTVKGVESNVGT